MAQYKGPAKESQRVMHLQKKREREQEELEFRKKKLADELAVEKMDAKFSAHYDAVEMDLKSATVGLLTVSEMKSRQELAVKEFFSGLLKVKTTNLKHLLEIFHPHRDLINW